MQVAIDWARRVMVMVMVIVLRSIRRQTGVSCAYYTSFPVLTVIFVLVLAIHYASGA